MAKYFPEGFKYGFQEGYEHKSTLFNDLFKQYDSVDEYFNDPEMGKSLRENDYYEGHQEWDDLRITRKVTVTRVKNKED